MSNNYSTHSEMIKAAACEQYSKHPEKKNVLPLDGTIALIVRKSVHTPENSIVISVSFRIWAKGGQNGNM